MGPTRRRSNRVPALSGFIRRVLDHGAGDGYGELGFDSGEMALESAITSKEGSRRANYPISTRGGSDEK